MYYKITPRLRPLSKVLRMAVDFTCWLTNFAAVNIPMQQFYSTQAKLAGEKGRRKNTRLLNSLVGVETTKALVANGVGLAHSNMVVLSKVLKYFMLERLDLSDNSFGSFFLCSPLAKLTKHWCRRHLYQALNRITTESNPTPQFVTVGRVSFP